ncbi:DUF6850 family outer membrane beta-barrel protein [Pedobacter sp. SYP-B3415]|uniref:DUF6850 family outer membrane beta-barrel protein n=1 Tax=Pedobacter sp. SYP-B3415 TaxID=2496641 RepID=UPI00101DFCA8|nr:DUF6850 family outer membrane beta-barrel protein [Pedobacter sp. SYP-B3415]
MKFLYIILLLILSAGGFAQTPADSIYLNPLALRQYGYQTSNIAGLANFRDTSTATIDVGYGLTQGSFRKAQQPFRDQQALLGIQGINTFKRFRTFGKIRLTRSYQDSLAWSAKGTEDFEQPYYYGSIKPGPFERTAYHLSGMLLYALVPGKLNIGSGIDYDFKTSTRSVDPRPEVNAFSLKLRPQLSYQLGNSVLYAGAIWGYGDEQNILTFKSITYRGSAAYPDRVNYLMQGYGLIAIRQGNQDFRRRLRNTGAEAGYIFTGAHLSLMGSLCYEQRAETNMIRLERSTATADIGRFDMDKIDARLIMTHTGGRLNHQLEVTAIAENGQDFNITKGGSNYYYDRTQAALNYSVQMQGTAMFVPDFGLSFAYLATAHEDIVSSHLVDYTRLEAGIRAGVLGRLKRGERLRADLGGRFGWSPDNSMSVPGSQETAFSRGVVYPDFAYATSGNFSVDFGLQIVTGRIVPGLRTGFSFNGSYLSKWKQTYKPLNAATNPGKDRFFSNFSINLYF